MWYDCQHPSVKLIPALEGKENPGYCRKHKPGWRQVQNVFCGVQPVMDRDEFCGEFREG